MNGHYCAIADYLDGALSDEQQTELQHALEQDDALVARFVEATHLNYQLRVLLQTSIAEPVQLAKPFRPATAVRFSSRLQNSVAASILLVALCFYGTFAFLAWNLQSGFESNVAAGLPSPVSSVIASVASCDNARWAQNSVAFKMGDRLKPGRLHLLSGRVELAYSNGTRLVMQGPSELTLNTVATSFLHRGTIRANVPARAAGFTIETDAATVVDLGTEFAMEVSDTAAVDVQVFEGRVDVQSSPPSGNAQRQSVLLEAGMARRVNRVSFSAGGTAEVIAWKSNHYPVLSQPTGKYRLAVAGVLASSEYGYREANNLINGAGMEGDRHSADPDHTMWHTSLGRVKNEFVLFDLGRRRHLTSMKVWNYNEGISGLFASRGIGKGSIYVSTSGKWDPIKEPGEWQCIMREHSFKPATGKDDYKNPEELALGGVTARFVAIVIEDHLAPDPRTPEAADQQCVGLSEVQFFGERIPTEKTEATVKQNAF